MSPSFFHCTQVCVNGAYICLHVSMFISINILCPQIFMPYYKFIHLWWEIQLLSRPYSCFFQSHHPCLFVSVCLSLWICVYIYMYIYIYNVSCIASKFSGTSTKLKQEMDDVTIFFIEQCISWCIHCQQQSYNWFFVAVHKQPIDKACKA